ncbi:DUF1642 domain-containing protein [Enterococcus sp. DIV0180]|uniref:DUF1642 domain-containing protein n=1 Tax=Enterococcus sp. DIV0180 TaxID=2774749 RepID=UPI003D2FF8D3
MNKQELIDEIKRIHASAIGRSHVSTHPLYSDGVADTCSDVIKLLEQLDEPQNPVVPNCAEQFLKIAQSSNDVIQLFDSIIYATDSDGLILEKWGWSVDFYNWLDKDSDTLYILCDALRYGYEVEKEPLYTVELPSMTPSKLAFDEDYCKYKIVGNYTVGRLRHNLTEKEIKYFDERYWAFAVPVEEVEG